MSCGPSPPVGRGCGSAPGRIRTCGSRFRKPLLSPLSYGGGSVSVHAHLRRSGWRPAAYVSPGTDRAPHDLTRRGWDRLWRPGGGSSPGYPFRLSATASAADLSARRGRGAGHDRLPAWRLSRVVAGQVGGCCSFGVDRLHALSTPPACRARQPPDPVVATGEPLHPTAHELAAQRVGDDLAHPAVHREASSAHGRTQVGDGCCAPRHAVEFQQQHRSQQRVPDRHPGGAAGRLRSGGLASVHVTIIAHGCDTFSFTVPSRSWVSPTTSDLSRRGGTGGVSGRLSTDAAAAG